jgi:hypothetical protein
MPLTAKEKAFLTNMGISLGKYYGKKAYGRGKKYIKTKYRNRKSKTWKKNKRRLLTGKQNRGNFLHLGSGNGKAFLPRSALISHNFSIQVAIDGGSMTDHVKFMRLNDIYDPAGTLSTIQPFGTDQMKALYQSYTVVGASWKVIFHNTAASSSGVAMQQQLFALIGRTDASGHQELPPDTPDEFYMEGWSGGGYMRHTYAGKPLTIRGNWSAKRQFKEYVDDDKLIRDTNIGAAINASPTTKALLAFGGFRNDNGDPLGMSCRVIIRYHVLWHNPFVLAIS